MLLSNYLKMGCTSSVGSDVLLLSGEGTPEGGQLSMQLARKEAGHRLIQGEKHGSRIIGGPIHLDALLPRNAPHKGLRGKAGHRALERAKAAELTNGPGKAGGEALPDRPGDAPKELAQHGRGTTLGLSSGLQPSFCLHQ
jgi:hypothetical protein